MKILVHVDQYDVVGILPSQLESIHLLGVAMEATELAFVDNTLDGVKGIGGFTRYSSLTEFFNKNEGPFVVFSPNKGADIRETVLKDQWMIFGPAKGFNMDDLQNKSIQWVKIPGGEMNSRDVVPIAMWEASKWVQ